MVTKILLCFLFCSFAFGDDRPIVKTPFGKIGGQYEKSTEGKTYISYIGIPYAKPPLGNLRFAEPQPIEPWNGVWQANISSVCVQLSHAPEGGELLGEEDCLHLNVYVPKTDKKNLDVIIHVHGGAFMFGASTYYAGPKNLMDRDVILVTMNYRLGPLGFLSTGDEVQPGNLGMKDQVAALRWIKENIKYFGGNDNSITLTGLSAGGASVHYHYFSPLSKGLFNRGISASGTGLCNWALQENEVEKTRQLAKFVGCPTKSSQEIIDCLRQRPARQIVEAVRILRPWAYNPFSPFAVNIDSKSKNPFLPAHPYKLLTSGMVNDVPWLTSVTADEGLYPVADYAVNNKDLPYLNKNWNKVASHILHYDNTIPKERQAEVSQKIREFYFKDQIISRKTLTQLIQLAGDRLFLVDAEKAARLQAKINKSPVYFYYFNYQGEEIPSIVSLLTHDSNKYGVSHGDDIMYIFSHKDFEGKLSKNDKIMKEILLDIYVSFAKTGVPTLKNVGWDPVDKNTNSKLRYLHINSPRDVKMKEIKELGHRTFWDKLDFKENENLYPKLKTEL